MVEENFEKIYRNLKVEFYKKIFGMFKEEECCLAATEAFSLEVIKILDSPTISEFADFLCISQSNATYKINNLIKKGYIEKENSTVDRREYHLVLSEKYYKYEALMYEYSNVLMKRINTRFSREDLCKLDEMLGIINEELMPECK